jgi:hypothetical protein
MERATRLELATPTLARSGSIPVFGRDRKWPRRAYLRRIRMHVDADSTGRHTDHTAIDDGFTYPHANRPLLVVGPDIRCLGAARWARRPRHSFAGPWRTGSLVRTDHNRVPYSKCHQSSASATYPQPHGVVGQVHVETDHIGELLEEQWIQMGTTRQSPHGRLCSGEIVRRPDYLDLLSVTRT